MDDVQHTVTPPRTRPWYRRTWGMVLLVYLAVSAGLAVWLLVAVSSTPSRGTSVDAGAARAIPADAVLVAHDDPALGAADAALTIVEFSDFQCPYCRRAFPIIREIAERYGDRIRYVYRDFPVEEIHEDARRAAEAAQCAHAQGKFWAYHDRLFQQQEAQCPSGVVCENGLDAVSLIAHARAVGLDVPAFEQCAASGTFADAVQGDRAVGLQLGVRGTPTWFFIPHGDVRRARRVEGVIPRDAFITFVEQVL